MSDTEVDVEQIQSLAKILKDLKPGEWSLLKETVDKMNGLAQRETPIRPGTGNVDLILNDEAATVVLKDQDFAISFYKDSVRAIWKGKLINTLGHCELDSEPANNPSVWLPINEIYEAMRHAQVLRIQFHLKNLKKKNEEAPEDKIRYMNSKSGRKAFAYGMVMGRKL